MVLLLLAATTNPARADCPAAPIADPDDMAISFLKANGVQAASASLLASSVKEGTLVYDDTVDKLKVCDGTSWIEVGSGSGTDTLASLSCSSGEIAKWNGTVWACAADDGGTGTPAVSGRAWRTSSYAPATAGTYYDLPLNAGDSDLVGVTHSTSTNPERLTVSNAGKYLITYNVNTIFNPAGSTNYARVAVNGTAVPSSDTYLSESNSSYSGFLSGSAVVTLNAGDYVTLQVMKNGGSNTFGQAALNIASIGGGGSDTLSGLSCAANEIPKYNGTAWVCAADGGGSGGNGTAGPSFYAHRNGVNQTVTTGTPTAVDWTHESFDTANAFDPATNRFTPQVAGKYAITASAYCTDASNYCQVLIYKNASQVATSFTYTDTAESMTQASTIVDMNGTTDYLTMHVVNASGTTLSGSSAITYFTGALLGGGSDTLAGLSCASGEIPKWNGTAWACAADGGGSGSSGAIQSATQATDPLTLADGVTTDVVSLTASTTGTYTILANGYTNAATPWAYLSSNCHLLVNGTVVHQQPFYYGAHDAAAGSSPFFPHTLNAVSAITAGQVVKVRCMSTSSSATRTANKWRIDLVPVGGGSGAPGGSDTQVQFNNAGVFDGDAALHWDNTNKRLTISSNAAPLDVGPFTNTVLHLSNVDGTSPRLVLDQFGGGNSTAANVTLRAAGGTGASPTALSDEDILGQLTFTGHDGTSYVGARAAIRGTATEAWSGSGTGADLRFYTTPNGTVAAIETMRLNHDGALSLGSGTDASASSILDLTSTTLGFLPPRMTTVQRDAIASPATGLMIFDTTAAQYQFWNGTAWSGLGSGGVPTGTIAAFALATCPSGWTEYTAARGRFLRGIDPTGASVDPDGTRAPGNLQADAMQQITGSMGFNRTAASNLVGAFVGGGTPGASGATSGSNAAGSVAFNSANSPSARTSVETRPKNVAVLFCQYNGSGGGGGGSSQWTDVTGGINYAGGKVGIGTTAPAGPLHVVTTAAVPAITMERTGDANVFLEFESTTGLTGVDGGGSSGFLRFYTAGAQRMIVNSAGNIGIGTTTPQSLLQVAGGIQLADDAAACPGASNVKLGTLKYGSNVLSVCNTGGWTTLTAGGGPLSGGTSGYLGVWTGATTMGLSSTSTSNQLFWDATNHRLGIGTTNPQDALDLGQGTNGRSIVWGGTTGANHYASIGTTYSFGSLSLVHGLKLATGGADQYLYSYATGSRAGIRIGGGAASDISFFNEPAATQTVGDAFDYVANTKMIIKDSGNVGIGTTAPSSLLHVKKDQTAATTQILVENVGAADPATISALSVGEGGVAYGSLRRYRDGSGTVELANVQNAPLHLLTNNIRRLTILGTGNVGIGTTTPQSLLSVADTGYAQFGKTFPGAPTTADCDAVAEAGRVTIDTTNGRWYVCDGVAWKFVSIGTSGSGGSSQWTTAGSHIHYATGGVAIGQASAPEASAALEVESTTKGFLPPRLTKAQRNAIPSPAAGLMIYQSVDKRIEWYDGTSWVTFSGSLIVANLDGTSSTTAGRSCKALLDSGHSTGNGLYWLDPDGSSSISAFQAYCDMSNGGWTLVTRQLSSVAASTHEVAAAVGTLTAPTQGSVAKLADSVINAIAGNSAAPVYKIDCAGRVNYYKLPSAFSATQTTWTAIQVSVVSDSVSFFTINATYAGCSKGPHSCDASSPSAWGANAGRNPGALYGAGGGFVNTNGCSYSDSTASQSAWSAGSGTTWVK